MQLIFKKLRSRLSLCMHWCFLLFLFCYSSILHARHHSSQQVCRHRITGQQLSKHPAADTGRILGYIPAGCLCPSKGGVTLSALTVITAQTLETYKRLNACQNLSYSLTPRNLRLGFLHLSSHTIPSHIISVHLYVCILQHAWFAICAHLFIWHICSQHLRWQAFSLAAFFIPSPCYLSFLIPASVLQLLSLQLCCPACSFSAFCFLPISPSSFLPFTTVPHSYASSMSAGLESLVSNHTHLEPAQLSSTTHGNHLKLLSGSPPFFLCSLFSYFFHLSIPLSPDPFLPLRFFYPSLPLCLAQIFVFPISCYSSL